MLVTEESHYCHYGSRKIRLAGQLPPLFPLVCYHCSEDQVDSKSIGFVFQSFILPLCVHLPEEARRVPWIPQELGL